MLKINNIKNANSFIIEIENMIQKGYQSYIDAVIDYCSKNNIDIETAASMLKTSTKLKSKIQKEAEDINLLPKTNNLGI